MKISVTSSMDILLEEVYNSVILKTSSNETIAICMRDSGFEFKYQGRWYSAQKGIIEQSNKF